MQGSDFSLMVFEGHTMVSVNILYFLPDQKNLVNEFLWQTLDLSPQYPRVHRFLNFWKKEIDATIKQVIVAPLSKGIVIPEWRHGIIIK